MSKAMLFISSIIALFLILHISSALSITVHQGESIQAALDAAKSGDLIEVENGTYHESVDINKQVVLRGVGYPVIDAMGNCTAVILSAGGTSIEGFRIISSGTKESGFCDNAGGIYINSSNNTIRGNRISNNTCGIFIDGSSDNIIENNTVMDSNSFGTGIALHNCHDNLIEDNVVSHNQMIGIATENSSCNVLRGNQVFDNAWIFPILGEFEYMAGGISLLDSRNNTLMDNSIYDNYVNFGIFDPSANDIDASNLVEGKPVRILKGVFGVTINASEAGVVFCINCSNITLDGLTLTNNTASVWLDNTTDSIVRGCSLKNSTIGISLDKDSSNITIENNTIADCIDGLSIPGAHNTITGNIVERCGRGLSLTRGGDHFEPAYLIDPEDITANRIMGNTVSNGIIGIDISYCAGNTLMNNSMYGNLINLYLGDMPLETVNEIDTSNLVNGKKVYHLRDVADLIIDSSSNAGMIFCKNSSNLTLSGLDIESCRSGVDIYNAIGLRISGCHISGCENGIAIGRSRDCLIEGNRINNNGDGISVSNSNDIALIGNMINNSSYSRMISDHLNASNISEGISLHEVKFLGYSDNTGLMVEDSDNITLLNNTVGYSEWSGIQLEEAGNCTVAGSFTTNNSLGLALERSNNNTIRENRAIHNKYGLKLLNSKRNRIYSNVFVDNEIANAFDEDGSNLWDNGIKGNYYGDMNCTDFNGDEICESPYPISGGSSVDGYPLRELRMMN